MRVDLRNSKNLVKNIVSQKKLNGFFKKSKGWRLDFRGPNLFDKGVKTVIMSNSNADLIAVSLACLKDPKNLLLK